MSITKTLGGDRLGSGNKNKVELHGYERSTHNTSTIKRTTMSAGTLVPILTMVALPGDTHDIDIDCDVKTHPTVGPLFGSYKVQIDVFEAPVRLYQGKLHNNKLGVGMDMSKVALPQVLMQARRGSGYDYGSPDNTQVNPSSLFAYLGIRGVGSPSAPNTTITRSFNGLPLLTYWDIYKNYYANKQEEVGAYIHNATEAIVKTITIFDIGVGSPLPQAPAVLQRTLSRSTVVTITYSGATPKPYQVAVNTTKGRYTLEQMWGNITYPTSTTISLKEPIININQIYLNNWDYIGENESIEQEPNVEFFPLENIDDMREQILQDTKSVFPFEIEGGMDAPYGPPLYEVNGYFSKLISQEGLGLKTYQSDLFNNWLSTEWVDGTNGINEITAISTAGGNFQIDTLNLANKVYNMLNRIAVSGGSYYDWLDAVYAHDQYRRCETPMYMGGLSKELVFQEVVSTTGTVDAGGDNYPLGTLAGKGRMSGKHKGGKVRVKVDEPAYIMAIVSLTPRVDYSQGNTWDVNLKTMNDFHKPALDQIGFQDLICEQMAWWDTGVEVGTNAVTQHSAGKQPAWINYMTNVNMVYGNFAIQENEMFMTLNRRYEQDETVGPTNNRIKDLTTYIDPVKCNYIFAQTTRDAQNFWVQVGFDITSRRKMSAKIMPNL